jgi:preprotein translocase subunit SecA
MGALLASSVESEVRSSTLPVVPDSGRLGNALGNLVRSYLDRPWNRRLARAAKYVPAIRYFEQEYGRLDEAQLRTESNKLRGLARSGDTSSNLLTRAFAICSVAVWRQLGFRPFDVQLAAGAVMYHGAIVELATGEGKTLTASFPVFLHALAGRGVHVCTVNDYLAKRDAEILGPVYASLGLKVGTLQMNLDDAARTAAYRADVTYGTASEFGFDFLRDRLKIRGGEATKAPFWAAWQPDAGGGKLDPKVQRELYFALVDEADSIFIDEAKTPLIISSPTRMASPEESVVYMWADALMKQMTPKEHFQIDLKKDKIELTELGRQLVRYSNPPTGAHSKAMDKLFDAIEKAIHAHFRFVKDHHYMVIKEKVVIVDESTGRPMPDRHWREGLHQAVEAKEKVPIHLASDHAAQITFQSYFRQYRKLAGMTGTVVQNRSELRRVFKLWVVGVPTNRPIIRKQLPDRVFATEEAKFNAIVEEVKQLQAQGRPVLIGTRSVEKSEALSEKLTAAGVKHQVLNARQNEQENMIVAQAGRPGTVTVATNMAGRGTDIKLGGALDELERKIREDESLNDEQKQTQIKQLRVEWQRLHDQVVAAGGLHVIGTERHEALRIDRQLMGRSGRQGDPGSAQFFVSAEDQILEALGHRKRLEIETAGQQSQQLERSDLRPWFSLAQRRVEKKHYRQRLDLLHYDKQRQELLADLGADPFVD